MLCPCRQLGVEAPVAQQQGSRASQIGNERAIEVGHHLAPRFLETDCSDDLFAIGHRDDERQVQLGGGRRLAEIPALVGPLGSRMQAFPDPYPHGHEGRTGPVGGDLGQLDQGIGVGPGAGQSPAHL